MKTYLKKIAILAAAVLMVATGCQQTSQQQRRPVATTPEPAPTYRSEPAAPSAPASRTSCTDPTRGLVVLSKQMPAEAGLGQTFEYVLQFTAHDCVGNVIITDDIPEGASFVKAEPEAQVQGSTLAWRIKQMDANQQGTIRVWVKADREGTLTSCATVSADPRVCASTFVGKPSLTIDKSGPETASLGDTVNYTIVVANNGTAVARGVVVTDTIPQGLESADGRKTAQFEIGDLAPGQSRSINLPLKAAARGKHCNVAEVSSSNAGKATDEACTTVLQPGLKVTKEGDKERFLGRQANYRIVVSNTGDTTLNDVVVTDTAPAATSIVSADGATVTGNTATWRIPALPAGEQRALAVVLTSDTAGTHCNTVAVSSGGLQDRAEACTLWRGVGAILIEVVDDPDPIQADEQTTYTIRVTNQGTADLTNINLVAEYDVETSPVSSPDGEVSGQIVQLRPVARLAAKQSFTYTIRTKGVSAGDSRNKVTLTADGFTRPIVEEESTTVY